MHTLAAWLRRAIHCTRRLILDAGETGERLGAGPENPPRALRPCHSVIRTAPRPPKL